MLAKNILLNRIKIQNKLKFQNQIIRLFSQDQKNQQNQESSSELGSSDSESQNQKLKNIIDPNKGQYTDFLKNVNVYEESNEDTLKTMYFLNQQQRLSGYATPEGTEKYYRMSQYGEIENLNVHIDNFRSLYQNEMLRVTSIGIGTYVGDPDDVTDFEMYNAIKTSVLSGGVNHIDTAPNYRYMKSEKVVGKILNVLDRKYDIQRNQLFVASKAGYIAEDADNLISQREMIQKIINQHNIPVDSIQTESGHCIHPKYLELSLDDSLERLNLECLDLLYLHNPYEAQGPYNTDNEFFKRLGKAFEFLEEAVEKGKIKNYGIASYSCFRAKPQDTKMYLNIQKVYQLAQKVGGDKHHFNFAQVPINVLMPEAFCEPWQEFIDKDNVSRQKMFIAACNDLQINLVSSQALAQGLVANVPLSKESINGIYNLSARHLQFIRSIPSKALKSTLVGMKKVDNVRANLEIVQKPVMTREEFFEALAPHRRREFVDQELDI